MKRKINVVMADDDIDDKEITKRAFDETGFNCRLEFVNNGGELIEHLIKKINVKAELPDFLLLDLNMPVMDGQATIKNIRLLPQFDKLPLYIFSTAAYDAQRTGNLLHSGASKCLTKPSDFKSLVTLMRNLCMEVGNDN